MTRHEVGKHLDTQLREGKPPRVEPVFGSFCPTCNATSHPEAQAERDRHTQAWLVGALVLVGGAILGLLVLFGN